MKRLRFIYEMCIDYSEVVSTCYFTIKCIPGNTGKQKIEDVSIKMIPETSYHFGVDGLGNTQIYGENKESHTQFFFRVEGIAYTGLCQAKTKVDEGQVMIYRHPHGLNRAGGKIQEFFESLHDNWTGTCKEQALYLMHKLHEEFQYEANRTTVTTTAEEAFLMGHGVCQDYAHIYIALLHLAGIPARYVTGLIIGEGASHAWVEAFIDGEWVGLDPTNNVEVADDHIQIGIGRDAADCMINRGIMRGGGGHAQSIRVSVNEEQ